RVKIELTALDLRGALLSPFPVGISDPSDRGRFEPGLMLLKIGLNLAGSELVPEFADHRLAGYQALEFLLGSAAPFQPAHGILGLVKPMRSAKRIHRLLELLRRQRNLALLELLLNQAPVHQPLD